MFEINIEEETVHENSQSHWSDSENFNEALSDLNPEKNLKD